MEKLLLTNYLLESCTDRIVGRAEGLTPVQVTAGRPHHELHQALCEAVVLGLLARIRDFVELLDQTDSEGAPDLGVELNFNHLRLPNVLHVGAGPELGPLVEVDVVGSGEVRQKTAGGKS